MEDSSKNALTNQLDQEILDARGINMTVEEVAGLPTSKYSERVQALKLGFDDLAFLKGLRRRIKNRLASQNSRRRSVEHLRRLTREIRAVRACRSDVISERRSLVAQRDAVREKCEALRLHCIQILHQRLDPAAVPTIDVDRVAIKTEYQTTKEAKKITVTETKTPALSECFKQKEINIAEGFREKEKNIFECRIEKLVQQSVNHLYKNDDKKKVFAKTVFISNQNINSVVLTQTTVERDLMGFLDGDNGVLNLSVKEGRRKSHGRKQPAPRRITYLVDSEDGVLDLKIKTENE